VPTCTRLYPYVPEGFNTSFLCIIKQKTMENKSHYFLIQLQKQKFKQATQFNYYTLLNFIILFLTFLISETLFLLSFDSQIQKMKRTFTKNKIQHISTVFNIHLHFSQGRFQIGFPLNCKQVINTS